MRILKGEEETEAERHMDKAADVAVYSKCFRGKHGCVIVKNGMVVGTGFNSPPKGVTLEKCLKDILPKDFKSDRTCCIHAEEMAILDTSKDKLEGARLYFVSINEKGKIKKAGKPYCTICSKMALHSGIAEFVLWHEEGITVYDTKEYNDLSFKYKG